MHCSISAFPYFLYVLLNDPSIFGIIFLALLLLEQYFTLRCIFMHAATQTAFEGSDTVHLFEIVPEELFSLLASPNRRIYSDALMVLHDAFHENLRISKSCFFSMLRSRLESDLASTEFSDEGIYEEEAQDLSGRARFLIRKLRERGWIDMERGDDFEEYIIVPDYSIRLLELFSSLTTEKTASGFSYVYETYSTLHTANGDDGTAYEKMIALYSAYDKTLNLLKLLKTVYHNINRYCQNLLDLQHVNQVLAMHYDDFFGHIIETYIRPLKIKESVPKYKIPIQEILDDWLENSVLLDAMADAALHEKRFSTKDDCKIDIVQKLFFVKESYEDFEPKYLNEIDNKVRRYTRSTTQKIENLTNNDQSVRGNLIYLLNALSDSGRLSDTAERIQPVFQLFSQEWFCRDTSLYARKRGTKRIAGEPILLDDAESALEQTAAKEFAHMMNSPFSKEKVRQHMEHFMEERQIAFLSEMHIENDQDYVLSALAVIAGSDKASFYQAEPQDITVTVGSYAIPDVKFIRKKEM